MCVEKIFEHSQNLKITHWIVPRMLANCIQFYAQR